MYSVKQSGNMEEKMKESKGLWVQLQEKPVPLSKDHEVGPIEYWVQPKKGNTVADRKASWPIYNEHLEDLNPYSNGAHQRRVAGQKRIRTTMKKK